ncbi:hypothetical protein HGM15179_020297, partial [Zosterops borbonicus]
DPKEDEEGAGPVTSSGAAAGPAVTSETMTSKAAVTAGGQEARKAAKATPTEATPTKDTPTNDTPSSAEAPPPLPQAKSPPAQATPPPETFERLFWLVAPSAEALRIWMDAVLTVTRSGGNF